MLDLAPKAVSAIAALGDPQPELTVSERRLRLLLKLTLDGQQRAWHRADASYSSWSVSSLRR
jgi:hypothetical protein